MNQIDPTLMPLAVDIDSLIPLPGNPRKGNVEAIMASYREFGQVKPIVVRPNGDGTSTVVAGNHQLEAAKRLGWERIAAVQYEADDQKATAFALADNRTSELGHTDPELLDQIVSAVTYDYGELLENLGWDEFELAALGEQADRLGSSAEDDGGYIPPQIIEPISPPEITREVTEDGERIVPTGEVDAKSVAATGSTSIGQSGSKQAVVQYTLVFDSADQQKRWYDFVRWLRADPGYDGNTTAERLMNFVEAHSDF
jgi:hypothetical protein